MCTLPGTFWSARWDHEVIFHDLYEEGFNPVIKHEEIATDGEIDGVLRDHCKQVASADGIIVIHPNWWGQPPAILKGWVDRVIRPGVAYKFNESDNGEGVPIGFLKAQTALVFNTSNTFPDREIAAFVTWRCANPCKGNCSKTCQTFWS